MRINAPLSIVVKLSGAFPVSAKRTEGAGGMSYGDPPYCGTGVHLIARMWGPPSKWHDVSASSSAAVNVTLYDGKRFGPSPGAPVRIATGLANRTCSGPRQDPLPKFFAYGRRENNHETFDATSPSRT